MAVVIGGKVSHLPLDTPVLYRIGTKFLFAVYVN